MKRRSSENLESNFEDKESSYIITKEILNMFDEAMIVDVNKKEIVENRNGRLNYIGKCDSNCCIRCEECLCEALNDNNEKKTQVVFNNEKVFLAQAKKIKSRTRGKNLVLILISRVDKTLSFDSKNNTEVFKELKSFNRTLYRDKLTDVYNRNFLSDRVEKMFERCKRESKRFCIAAIDIDKFKNFNDTYGHDFGDEVLRYVAENMKNVASSIKECFVIRIGGDEFNIVASDIRRDKFKKKMEELRENVENTKVKFGGQEASVKISIGTAELIEESSESYTELYKKADERLYEAKNNGRNTVV